jgi:hypothetical protein
MIVVKGTLKMHKMKMRNVRQLTKANIITKMTNPTVGKIHVISMNISISYYYVSKTNTEYT